MQLRLFNDAGCKVLVNINGINYMIKRNRFLVVQCPDNCPVTIKLMIKFKSFVLPPLDEIFDEAENRLHAQKAVMVLLMQ